ncbi:MAG TPA: serine hydrolase domain-containing protein [Candidatus Dormibacteraeota bacterium]|nr:serine hydrolase domain-containing protein [Candidatus Dormibacteraeota bacterium]
MSTLQNLRRRWTAGLAALGALIPLTAAATPVFADSGPDYAAVDRYVQDQVNEARIPGLALGIVHGAQVTHLQGFGRADSGGRPVTPQTPFIIGSISKSFTAVAVLQLAEAGKVDLDAPVQRYLPEFRLADPHASAAMTTRHLLNQTSGIPTSAGITPLSEPVSSLEAQVRALVTVTPSAQPGRQYEYSNSNYEVLGRLVETVSGQGYGDYVQEHIFAPLGMEHSFASLDAAKRDGLASASTLWFGMQQAHAQGAGFRSDTVPAGFLMSSAEDMSHFVAAQLNNGQYPSTGASLLSAAGVAELHRPAAAAGLSAQGGSYAMGWFNGPRSNLRDTIWHNGSAASMHSIVIMLPAENWGVILLTNVESILYETLARIDIIADNVASLLTNRPLAGTLAGLYLVFDAVAALVIALAVRNLARIVRGRRKVRTGRLARVRTVFFQWVVPIWREFWVPVAILLGVPAALGAPWFGNLLNVDIGQWLFVFALLLLASGIVRLVLAIRRPT